jgi:hypothetical protein
MDPSERIISNMIPQLNITFVINSYILNNKLDQLRFAISILGLGLGELLSSLTTLGELGLVIGLLCTLIFEGLSGSLLPRRLDLSLNVV